MNHFYLLAFGLALVLSCVLTFIIRKVALAKHWLPKLRERDVHTKPTPRLGGLAVFLSFLTVIFICFIVNPQIFNFPTINISIGSFLINKHLFGILIASIIIVTIMILDDIRGLSPWTKLFWQVFAALIVIASGIGIEYIRNPFGGEIYLNQIKLPIQLFSTEYHIVLWEDLFTLFWLVGMMNIINFLDGLDGLAGGVSFISATVIFFLAIAPGVGQIATAILAITLAGAILGFLPWNFPPAKIFLGDTGSMLLGFMLGVLAIVSGGKVATAFLVLGFPILDGIWVTIQRIRRGQSPFKADQTHFHHRMLKIGLGPKITVFLLYMFSALFGIVALFSSTREKMWAIIWLIVLMISIGITAFFIQKTKKST